MNLSFLGKTYDSCFRVYQLFSYVMNSNVTITIMPTKIYQSPRECDRYIFWVKRNILFIFCNILTEINYCKSSPCHPNATCISHSDSLSCNCKNDFTGSGLECAGKFIKSINCTLFIICRPL